MDRTARGKEPGKKREPLRRERVNLIFTRLESSLPSQDFGTTNLFFIATVCYVHSDAFPV